MLKKQGLGFTGLTPILTPIYDNPYSEDLQQSTPVPFCFSSLATVAGLRVECVESKDGRGARSRGFANV